MDNHNNEFVKFFTDGNFWDKVFKFAKNAGIKVVYVALLLYYTLMKEDLPVGAKATIIAALGYFISPIDAIPDITPIIGFSDDLGVLILALSTIVLYIDDDVKNKAKAKLRDIFGEIDVEDVADIDDRLSKA